MDPRLAQHQVWSGVIRRQENYYQIQNGTGQFTWSAATAGAPPDSLANFLLGVPTTITRQFPFQFQYYRTWEPHLLCQDDWHVSRKLTLNLGLRWDHIGQLQSRPASAPIIRSTPTSSASEAAPACSRTGYSFSRASVTPTIRAVSGISRRIRPELLRSGLCGRLTESSQPAVCRSNFTCSPAALTGSTVCPPVSAN